MRQLMSRKKVDAETRDLASFIVLTLRQIDGTIDETCKAWEKRDYWVKADNFRQQWMWTTPTADKLEQVVVGNDWKHLPAIVLKDLATHLSNVTPPKRDWGTPWQGAYDLLMEKRARVVERR